MYININNITNFKQYKHTFTVLQWAWRGLAATSFGVREMLHGQPSCRPRMRQFTLIKLAPALKAAVCNLDSGIKHYALESFAYLRSRKSLKNNICVLVI